MVDEDKAILGDDETLGIGDDGEDLGEMGVQTSGKFADHLAGLMRTEVTGIEFSIASIILAESFGPTAS